MTLASRTSASAPLPERNQGIAGCRSGETEERPAKGACGRGDDGAYNARSNFPLWVADIGPIGRSPAAADPLRCAAVLLGCCPRDRPYSDYVPIPKPNTSLADALNLLR